MMVAMRSSAIAVCGLRKAYGDKIVLDGIDLVPGSHIQLRFTDVVELDTAARILPGSTRDDEALTLRVPGDGGTKSLRDLLDRLGEHSIEAEEFAVHTPDLDDVFLALTGHPSTAAIAP